MYVESATLTYLKQFDRKSKKSLSSVPIMNARLFELGLRFFPRELTRDLGWPLLSKKTLRRVAFSSSSGGGVENT